MNKYLEKIAAMSMKDVETVHRGYDNPGWQALNYGTPAAVVGGAAGVGNTVYQAAKAAGKGPAALDKHIGNLLGHDWEEAVLSKKDTVEGGKRIGKLLAKKMILPGAIGAAAGTAYGVHRALKQNKAMDAATESSDHNLRQLARESALSSKKSVLGHTLAGFPNPLFGSMIVSGVGAHLTNKHIEKQLEKTRD